MSYHRGSINTLQNASIWRYGTTKTVFVVTLVVDKRDFADKITTMYFKCMTKLSAYFFYLVDGCISAWNGSRCQSRNVQTRFQESRCSRVFSGCHVFESTRRSNVWPPGGFSYTVVSASDGLRDRSASTSCMSSSMFTSSSFFVTPTYSGICSLSTP